MAVWIFFLCSPDRPKQPRIEYPFYRCLYPMISGTMSRGLTDLKKYCHDNPHVHIRSGALVDLGLNLDAAIHFQRVVKMVLHRIVCIGNFYHWGVQIWVNDSSNVSNNNLYP